jgi:hypothetical protein
MGCSKCATQRHPIRIEPCELDCATCGPTMVTHPITGFGLAQRSWAMYHQYSDMARRTSGWIS